MFFTQGVLLHFSWLLYAFGTPYVMQKRKKEESPSNGQRPKVSPVAAETK